jgi:bacterial/archaeal transporter family-2 protein
MTLAIVLALAAGVLVAVSRQVNGRLSLSAGALGASFWNHAVGFLALTFAGSVLWLGGPAPLIPAGAGEAHWTAYLAGPLGVVFVALGSVAVTRIGAMWTTSLLLAAQMTTGLTIDTLRDAGSSPLIAATGVMTIASGLVLAARR